MVSQIRRGVIDFIGAARPSIADPFLPKKIEEGRIDDIRECIGCNLCVSGDNTITPIRCTQNPTMGEEWRRDWHPETIAPAKVIVGKSAAKVLVIGGGPAGLEAARALGQRGYEVHLAEARRELGGRVTREARLPGLAEWARVRDWRIGQIRKMPHVATYLDSALTAQDVLDFGAEHAIVATGCRWRRDGVGRSHGEAIPGFLDNPAVFTPDDIMDGRLPDGPVAIYDDDYFYTGSTIAEALRRAGREVVYVTPDDTVASWSANTLEYRHIQWRMAELGIEQIVSHAIVSFADGALELEQVWSGRRRRLDCAAVVTITSRLPEDALYHALTGREADRADAGVRTVVRIGDALAPGLIAHAVYTGHRYARELDEPTLGEVPFKRHFHTPRETDLLRTGD